MLMLQVMSDDPESARYWLVAAAEAGDVSSMMRLARSSGDSELALSWYRKAFKADNIAAAEFFENAHLARISDQLAQLVIQEGPSSTRVQLAGRPDMYSMVAERLSTDADENVRRELAGNWRTPQNILRVLANDPYPAVRASVARNPNTPDSILREIGTTADQESPVGSDR